MPKHSACDYVIVGAGSAGCTLAHRLTQDRDIRVVLLEAGGWDRDPLLHIPLAGRNVLRRRHDWMYATEPSATMAGRRIPIYRGRVIGGSSSINAMAYVRGHRGDYDRWADHGLSEWSYAHVLPYFRRQETWAGGGDVYRGDAGPLGRLYPHFPTRCSMRFSRPVFAPAIRLPPTTTAASRKGFSRGQSTIRHGRRCSAAAAYLRPALHGQICGSKRGRCHADTVRRRAAPSASGIGATARSSICAPSASYPLRAARSTRRSFSCCLVSATRRS